MKNRFLFIFLFLIFCSNIKAENIIIEAKNITLNKNQKSSLFENEVKVKTKEEVIGESDMDEIDKWSKVLINENSNYFIARTTYKKQKMNLLINTKN